MAQLVECVSGKHEDLNLDPRIHIKIQSGMLSIPE